MPGLILIIVIALLAIVLIIAVYAVFVALRRDEVDELVKRSSEQALIRDAYIDPGERPSSVVSEQIEEMVRARLAAYPDLAEITLDFGAGEDGSRGVWVGDNCYDDPADVPDERIRLAIAEAVAEFNARRL